MADTWVATIKTWVAAVLTSTALNEEIRDRAQVLANAVDGDTSATTIKHRHLSGIAASRPAAGEAGRFYYATDTKTMSIDNGVTWDMPVTVIRKTSSEQKTSDTSLSNDGHLLFAIPANENWMFQAMLYVDGTTNADIKIAFTVPAGATLIWSGIGLTVGAASSTDIGLAAPIEVSGAAAVYGLLGVGNKIGIPLWGTVINAGTAGDVQLQWAQNVPDGSATTVYINSWLKAHTIA